MAAVTQFDQEDLASVMEYKREKKKLLEWSKVVDDFVQNKEWWYRRIKMYPPDADQSLENIRTVLDLIHNDEELSKLWSSKLEDWFENLLSLCRQRKLEETSDCFMFQKEGKDSNGLQRYIRRKATAKKARKGQTGGK